MDEKKQDLIKVNQYIKPNYHKLSFQGVNRIQKGINNTFVSCVWNDPQFFSLALMDSQGLKLATLKLSTNFIPEFKMLNREKVIVLSRQRKANYLILWNIITKQQFKLKLSCSFSSKCEIHTFSNSNKVCLVDKNREKKQFIVQYFDIEGETLKATCSLNRTYKDQKAMCTKINEESGLILYNKQFNSPSQPLQINKIDDLGTDTIVKIATKTITQSSYMINDVWQIEQNIYYIQILTKNANQSLYYSFYWDNFSQTSTIETKLPINSPHLFYFIGSNRQLEAPPFHIKGVTIFFINFDSQERIVGYITIPSGKLAQLINWPSFTSNQMICKQIDHNSRELKITEWQFPFNWRINPEILTVFLLEAQNQKWDQSLVENATIMLEKTQNSVRFLLQ